MSDGLSRGEFLKVFFGNAHQLDIMGRVALFSIEPPEQFFTNQIARESGIPQPIVRVEIQRMSKLGMIVRTEGVHAEDHAGLLPSWYVRCESPWWELVDLAVRIVNTEFPEQ